ncbi:MAG: hypothetical protein K8963_04370 [Proteobacteria bacterium]|nr:hypothetical protein [Pseudomonadota bacterium]
MSSPRIYIFHLTYLPYVCQFHKKEKLLRQICPEHQSRDIVTPICPGRDCQGASAYWQIPIRHHKAGAPIIDHCSGEKIVHYQQGDHTLS